jgi:hypothetical protein
MTRRAAAAPEYCCWPVTSRPSRIANSENVWSTRKFVPSIFLALSLIQNGSMRLPAKPSANFSSLVATPVQVFPFTGSSPFESLVSRSSRVAWHTSGVTLPAS